MVVKSTVANILKVDKNLLPDYIRQRTRDPEREKSWVVEIPNGHLQPKEALLRLKDLSLQDCKDNNYSGFTSVHSSIKKALRFVEQSSACDRTVSDLDDLLPALKAAVEEASPDRHWIYREMGDGEIVPAYVSQIEFHRRRGQDDPARVDMTLVYLQLGKIAKMTVAFHRSSISERLDSEDSVGSGSISDIDTEFEVDAENEDDEETPKKTKSKGRSVKRKLHEILSSRQLLLETEELYESYKASIPEYYQYQGKCGIVAKASGDAFYMSSHIGWRDEPDWNCNVKACDRDGIEIDVVLDDSNVEKVPFRTTNNNWLFFREKDDEEYQPPKFWQKASVSIPFHPYLLCYDLDKHFHAWLHVNRLEKRNYESGILDKLVLPDSEKSFLSMLMGSAGIKMDDIIKGKSGGVFVLSEGPPGTGKTLTAEIYSESMQKPLYTVQCSQLGISPEDIEKRLNDVLRRAQRWNAVLLLDEADVYIRSRDVDVKHNAIVGVMLRVIERYSGLLFMTTNLSNIDDAVLSRATAHIKYKNPGIELLQRIWEVLSEQYKVKLTKTECIELSKLWTKAVGRDVKNLLKLARLASVSTGKDANSTTIKQVSNYLDMETKK